MKIYCGLGGGPLGFPSRHGAWVKIAGTVLFWGFSPELSSADAVMAEIRKDFRCRWGGDSGIPADRSGEDLDGSRKFSDESRGHLLK